MKPSKGMLAVGALIIFVAIVGSRQLNKEEAVPEEVTLPSVTLIDLSTYQEDSSRVEAQGEVESSAQVDLQAEVSARITSMPVTLGQEVFVGQVIATFDSSELFARLQQAQADLAAAEAGLASAEAALDAQEAQLLDLQKGGRPEQVIIAESQLRTAEDALNELYIGTQNALEAIVASVENVVYTQVDTLFDSPRSSNPTINFSTTRTTNRIQAQFDRAQLSNDFPEWSEGIAAIDSTSPESVMNALADAEEKLSFIQGFLQSLTLTIGDEVGLSDSQEDAFVSAVAGARATVSGHISTVRSRTQSIDAQESAVTQAREQLELTIQGATREQVSAQEALVEQSSIGITSQQANIARAQGVIAGIQAELAKRAVRSPITGTVATLPFRVGELVSPGALVASVVNVNGLQVKAFVDSSDASTFSVGSPALVRGDIEGVVATISPSIDPTTRKVEVGVAISSEDAKLVVGEFVEVTITKDGIEGSATLLPLRAVDVSTVGSFIFLVEDNKIVARPVVLGRVVGESVEILSGLDNVTQIVSSVRGLNEGDEVNIRE